MAQRAPGVDVRDHVQAAVRWVRATAAEYGVDPQRLAALGESAGGHLAAMLATLGEGDLASGARIRAAVAWSGPMDLAALAVSRGRGWWSRLLPCGPDTCAGRWAQASPTTHVDGSDAPLLLVNSTAELVPLVQAEAMSGRLRAAGVEQRLDVLPGARHALDYRADAWPATLDFLARHLDAPPAAAGTGTVRRTGARSDSGSARAWWVPGLVGGLGGAAVVTLLARRGRR